MVYHSRSEAELTDIQKETYNGLFVINNDYFYVQPPTLETQSYVKYRTSLITDGDCGLRDKAILVELSAEEFWEGHEALKEQGLSEVIEEADRYYKDLTSGVEKK